MIQKDNIQEFRVLDLFSGAGGFSYGMEKNTHFKTVIALDLMNTHLQLSSTICRIQKLSMETLRIAQLKEDNQMSREKKST